MSGPTNASQFATALRDIHEQFHRERLDIEHEHGAAAGPILERSSRRFLIDRYLKALDWNADDASQVREEARGIGQIGDERLYFDFLGLAPDTKEPALLVEAKRFGLRGPREPGKEVADTQVLKSELGKAIERVLTGQRSALTAEWNDFLTDLRNYVRALQGQGGGGPYRVVITSGDWIIIFSDPIATFGVEGKVDPSSIHCFMTFNEIAANAEDIFDLLYRPNIVDTLPPIMELEEALRVLSPALIAGCRRGVYLGTRMGGPDKAEYPIRWVFPAVIVAIVGKEIGIWNRYLRLEAPLDATLWEGFFAALEAEGERLLAQVSTDFSLSLPDTLDDSLKVFKTPIAMTPATARKAPRSISTAGLLGQQRPAPYSLRMPDKHGASYLVGTGRAWFYRGISERGKVCLYHSHEASSAEGRGQHPAHNGYSQSSFTATREFGHCSERSLLASRVARCKVSDFDSHLCCQGCIFANICWQPTEKLPCPPPPVVAQATVVESA